jgi:hypothetical protein
MSEVAEIPSAELGNLKDRALSAFEEAHQRRQSAEQRIFEELEELMFECLQDTLGLTPGDAAALIYKRDSKSTTRRDNLDPATPSNDITCEVKVDGVRLRCHFIQVQVAKNADDTKIMADEVRFECQNGRGWCEFKSLAALGALLK